MTANANRRRNGRRPEAAMHGRSVVTGAEAVLVALSALAGGCGRATDTKPAGHAAKGSSASDKDNAEDAHRANNADNNVLKDKAGTTTAATRDAGGTHWDADAAPPARLVVTGEFDTPESALYDEQSDLNLVGDIAGSPLDKADNGFIARVAPTGEIETLKWIDGAKDDVELNAPKGLAFLGNALVVADIDHIRFFDRTTGAPLKQVALPGATFLNDLTTSRDGLAVYVTDRSMQMKDGQFRPSGTDAVYRVNTEGFVEEIVKDPALGGPNGILENAAGDLTVVNFRDGAIWTIDDVNAKPAPRTTAIAGDASPGQLYGTAEVPDGDFLVSSWGTNQVHRLHEGKLSLALEKVKSPADIGFDATRGRLLVPLFLENQFVIAAPAAVAR